MTSHLLHAEQIQLGYGEKTVVEQLDLQLPPHAITSILGPNGCGKSTLLRALSRLIPPKSGAVFLDGRPLQKYPARKLARTLGLLPQSPIAPEGIVVADLVGRGRHPHQGMFGRWTAHDHAVVAEALAATGTTELAERHVDELSGGQRQRVWIAMALAQETEVLLLDEPTTYLDLAHHLEVLDLLTDLNRRRGTTIVMVLHDINLAARYSDQLVTMHQGRLHRQGPPAEVITPATMREVFGVTARVHPDPVSGAPLVMPVGRHHTGENLAAAS